MNYKKLVSLFAVSTLALSACGTTDEADDTDVDTTETEDAVEDTASSSDDLMDRALENTGDAFPEYGLYVPGAWSADGRIVQYATGEDAVIAVDITTDHEAYNVYLLEDGVVTQVEENNPKTEFTVENPSADTDYMVGVSPDELGAVGDEVAEEDFYRAELVIIEEVEPAPETEE